MTEYPGLCLGILLPGGDKLNIKKVYDVLGILNNLSIEELCVLRKALFYLSENRFDAEEGNWVTLENGVHVQIGEGGEVTKGPNVLKAGKRGKKSVGNKKELDVRMQPKNTDYDWEYGDSINDFIQYLNLYLIVF